MRVAFLTKARAVAIAIVVPICLGTAGPAMAASMGDTSGGPAVMVLGSSDSARVHPDSADGKDWETPLG